MEKEKKTTKQPAKKTTKTTTTKKATPVKEKATKPVKATAKAEKVENVQVEEVAEKKTAPVVEEVKETKVAKEPKSVAVAEEPKKSKVTLNQELNLLIGLFSIMTIISFCFAFQGGDAEILGWELFLKSGGYSGVFKGLMILYVVSIFIDCILAIRVESENEIFNIVEKALYMFTVVMNFVVVAVLLSIITQVGIGLIIFFILSIVSAIVKFARIFAK